MIAVERSLAIPWWAIAAGLVGLAVITWHHLMAPRLIDRRRRKSLAERNNRR